MNASIQQPEPGLPPPLTTTPDMTAVWSDVETDFDTAAEMFVARHRTDGAASDHPVTDLRVWGVKPHDGHFALQPLLQHRDPILLRHNALQNLCTRLNVPVEFLRRLPGPLQLTIVNWALGSVDRPMPATLRLRGTEAAALVSDRYAALDADELITTLRSVLAQHGMLGEVRVRAVATGLTDALRITFPGRAVEPKVGDITHAGLDISTSSFGRSALHVRGLLFRLVCTNGLRVPQRMGEYSARHVGESGRLREFLADAVPTVLTHSSGLMDAWRRSVNVQVERLAELIESMRELTAGEREGVEREVTADAGLTELPERTSAYTLVNAITATARAAEPARRLELEGLAGQLLDRHVRAS
ncbi:MAG: DUF932 domain-containing protein [Candidatus Eisenbacteria bacterium]|nr:DUF932 domain-containing protein [Candidatus Eisenbacteria bacterium]